MFFTLVQSWRQPRRDGFCGRRTLLAACLVWLTAAGAASAQSWTQVINSNPEFYNSTMLLLTDGSVMVQSAWDYQTWTKLTPDSTGSYVNGTWTTLTPMSIPRQNFGSVVLSDGRVLVLGGQFSGQSLLENNTNTGEIYDPVTNRWRAMQPFPEPEFGAGPVALLQFGYLLAGSPTTDQTYVYYPPGDFWFSFGGSINGGEPKLRGDLSADETWLLTPDGSVVSYDIYATSQSMPVTATAQRFSSNSFTWIDSGVIPFPLTGDAQQQKMGPGGMLPNGRLIQVGGNNLVALYTPPNTTFGTGVWNTAPSLPAGMGSGEAPGAMLPDGNFVFLADTNGSSPSALFSYDFRTNTLTDISATLPLDLQFELFFSPASSFRMLILPNGGLLLATQFELWQYIPSTVPLDSWRPTIASISKQTASTYSVLGTRLNGISEGATFGNEARMSSNYPIVRLSQVGVARYARTTNWSAGLSRPGETLFRQFTFEVPAGLPPGTYHVSVIANGIQSLSVPINIAPSHVSVSFSNGTLSINGDAEANSFSVAYKQVKQSGVLVGSTTTITSTNPFTLINGMPSVTLQTGIDRINVNAQLGEGNDTVSFSGLFAKGMICNMGDGDDSVAFNYNSFTTQLFVEGGLGFDSVTFTGNSIPKQSVTSVP